jgi:hypothetical protein
MRGMTNCKNVVRTGLALALGALCACSSGPAPHNAFLDDTPEDGKADSNYLNPDGEEVEVDLEGDVQADANNIDDAPAQSAQFALTYLRQRKQFYLESLAEDLTQRTRVEWLVDGRWTSADQTDNGQVPATKLTHFRLRGINAVLLNEAKAGVQVGTEFSAPVPTRPFELYDTLQDTCADYDADIELDQSVYWYLWNPDKKSCKADQTTMKLTVSKMFAAPPTVYPEYDLLMKDKVLTVVVLSGQIGHGSLKNSDPGIAGPAQMADDLVQAGFKRVDAPLGTRLEKTVKQGTIQVDLYDARVFSGLDDDAHFGNFQKALSEHEIVVYDGHSMLGASDFWKRPTYPQTYQIFLYGGCLGYEYYVRPILEGKGGWANLDIMSSVVEVSADAAGFGSPALNKIFRSVDGTAKSSWRSILTAVRSSVGDSTFGVSGVTDNCYTPSGSRCK